MRFKDIPAWEENTAVRAAVAEVILAEADSAELLSEENYGYIDHISELYGTDFEDIIPAFISSHSGDSCGNMYGKIYKFNITPAFKELVKKFGLEGMYVDEDGRAVLQNLTLYKGKEAIFWCVSHEVFSGWEMDWTDDGLKDKVFAAAYGVLRGDDTFNEVQKICAQLGSDDRSKIESDVALMYNLCNYVDKERKYFVYCEPKRKCSYKEFCAVAKKYFTADIIAELEKSKSFFGLYPYGGPVSAKDIISKKAEDRGQFLNTPLYKKVELELCYIKIILGISYDADIVRLSGDA